MLQENLEQPVFMPSSSRDTSKESFLHMHHQSSSEVTKNLVKQLEFYNITSLNAETASYIIKSHDEYTDAYSKLWKSLKDAMPSTYGNLVSSPSEILCAAINCIQVLKGRQEREVRKVTVDIKTSLDSKDKASPIMWNYHKYIAAYYELWSLVRYTMPSYEDLIFLPPQIFCAAIDCIQMLKTKQEVEFQNITEVQYDPCNFDERAQLGTRDSCISEEGIFRLPEFYRPLQEVLITSSFKEFAEAFYKLWKVLRTMPDLYKIIDYCDYDLSTEFLDTMFSPSQILCEAIDCIQVLKSMQIVAVTDTIKISLYSQNKPSPILWMQSDYIDAYYEIWNLLKDIMPPIYGKLIFSPLHILSGAIDCIQELKTKQQIEFQKISADIKTTLYSKDPVIENSVKCLDAYFELWKEIKRTMPVPYRNLLFRTVYIDYAAADCAKRGHQLKHLVPLLKLVEKYGIPLIMKLCQ